MTFGERVKMFRILAGWSQSELAKRAGVSRPIITNVENGKHAGVHVENARKIARALNVTLDQLVGDLAAASPGTMANDDPGWQETPEGLTGAYAVYHA